MEERIYRRGDLIQAYLEAQDGWRKGYLVDASAYNDALHAHRESLRDGLERLFEIRLTREGLAAHRSLFLLFETTVRSMLAVSTPWSGFLDAGPLLQRLEDAGEPGSRVLEASSRLQHRTGELRDDHRDILDALLTVFLGDRAGSTFTGADLRALGVDDNPPDMHAYPLHED
ncbi:hypothetical protein [Actinoplanes sp. NPDC051851]|uniref:hypothetical protein n=1 Tax=Actinoplanes sp. NPDC051851 TaxID=3154753 RepID=UPI003432A169